MSDKGKPLDFTLGDHDILVECASGIQEILMKMQEMEKRMTKIETRVKNVEDWKIRVMAIVGVVGLIVGVVVRTAWAVIVSGK